jgi:non-ribosomal peptide synthetase component F
MTSDQEALWGLERVPEMPRSSHLGAVLRCRGPMHQDSLRLAFAALQRRHELLRATVVSNLGRPAFLVARDAEVPWNAVNLRAPGAASDRESRERELIEGAFLHPFLPERSPLWRVLWIQRAPDEGLLVVVAHQVIADVASLEVLFGELTEHYASLKGGSEPGLPDLEMPYSALVSSRERRLIGVKRAHLQAWWHGQLAGAPQAVFLPSFRNRLGSESSMVPPVRFLEDCPVTEAIRSLSETAGVSPCTVALAGLFGVLHRYTGERDIVLAVEAQASPGSACAGVVGPLSGPLPLRIQWPGQAGFSDIARSVGTTLTQCHRHRDLSYQEILRSAFGDPTPLASIVPRILCRFEGRGWLLPEFEGVEVSILERRRGTGPFHLVVDLRTGPRGLEGSVDFRTDVIERETVRRFTRHLQLLLSEASQAPTAPVSRLRVLPSDEWTLVAREWSHTWVKFREESAAHELLEEQARAHAGALAAICGDDRLTFGELNALANRVAHELRGEGLRAGDRVGVWLHRSLDLLVALLGVLKAGGTAVPLNASSPLGDVRQALRLTNASLLLTQPRLGRLLSSASGSRSWPHLVVLRRSAGKGRGHARGGIDWLPVHRDGRTLPVTPVPAIHTPASEAFLFVSPDPGGDKGQVACPLSHRSMANAIDWMIRQFQLVPEDELFHVQPLTLGPSVQNLLSVLIVGGTVRVASDADLRDYPRLRRLCESQPITILDAPPALLSRVLRSGPGSSHSRADRVRLLWVGGDPVSPSLLELIRTRFPAAGIAELGVASRIPVWIHSLRAGPIGDPEGVPTVTRLLQNVQYLVLDADLQPCPIGVPGRLAVRGAGLTDHAQDVPMPGDHENPGSACLTGDLARWCPDGTLELLGRVESRVQRGSFRIDLDAIETVLSGHPGVEECAAVAVAGKDHTLQIVAFVVAKSIPDPADWRQHLATHLPAWMLPEEFHSISEMPLTLEGRIDRAELHRAAVSGILPETGNPGRKAA